MSNNARKILCTQALVVVILACTGAAYAGVTVSVTITGPVEEILPLIQHLKDLGVGTGPVHDGGPSKVEIVSVGTSPTASPQPAAPAAQPPAPPPPPPKPPLALLNPKVDPSAAKPGSSVLVTVTVSDPDHAIDTVAAAIEGIPGTTELYDNGTHGDAAAGDKVWSATVALPPQVAPGDHPVTISAFGPSGSPVSVKGPNDAQTPLTASAKLTVQP